MQGLRDRTPFANLYAKCPADEPLTLVDVGCSGGVDLAWMQLAPKLRAIGYDANKSEIDRLNSESPSQSVNYFHGYVGGRPGDQFMERLGDLPQIEENPWPRLSVHRAMELRKARIDSINPQHRSTQIGPRPSVAASFPAMNQNAVCVPEHLKTIGIQDVDFLKVDIDGLDFVVLNSFHDDFDSLGILGVGIEVNFFGRPNATNNTFHNIDRYMREKGFDLFDLSFWRYSMAALPARFLWGAPAATDIGRIVQGDALYVRDFANSANAKFVDASSGSKIARLATIFACFNLPDCAAEVLLSFREKASEVFDIDGALDILTEQIRGPGAKKMSYAEHMDNFENDDPSFYTGWPR